MSFVEIDYKQNILIDSDFTETLHQNYFKSPNSVASLMDLVMSATRQIIKSYHSRGLNVIDNLFRFNLWFSKHYYKHQSSFEDILSYQKYMMVDETTRHYIGFPNKLQEMWNKVKVFQ